MTKEDVKKHISVLAEKSAKTQDSGDALRFSQAALNLANTFNVFNLFKPE